MPPTTPYQPTKPPDSPTSDSDSDLELDLHELDPQSTSTSSNGNGHGRKASSYLSADREPAGQSRGPRIALRNLRMGGARRGARTRGYGELGRSRDGVAEEDAEALLGEDGEAAEGNSLRGSLSDGRGADEAALLGREYGARRQRSLAGNRIRDFTSNLRRLPSLMSNSGREGREEDQELDQEEDDPSTARVIAVGATSQATRFPPNVVSNAKYTPWSFLPVTLYNEFSFFFNMYFLLVALSQVIPALRIGYLMTYVAPLAFVLTITLGKEAYDDIQRRKRDNEANSEEYTTLLFEDPSTMGKAVGNRKPRKKLKSAAVGKKGKKRAANPTDRLSDIQEEEEQVEGHNGPGRPSSFVSEISKKSRDLKVGDVLKLSKGQRVPADVVILKCLVQESAGPLEQTESTRAAEPLLEDLDEGSELATPTEEQVREEVAAGGNVSGETFIRTDQLDGETDWKLRLASPLAQALPSEELVRLRVTGGKPDRKVNEFVGKLELGPSRFDTFSRTGENDLSGESTTSAPLSIDNTAWANTVIASQATTLAVIMYTGVQTRSALSTSPSRSKTGLLEYEINSLTKILCILTLLLSIVLVALEGFSNTKGNVWYIKIMRFLVLFSTIVPISLRVNLDLGKSVYSWFIQRDPGMPGALVRTSTIPEDLGRIEYLLSDKTGTLTQNDMEMKKIHVGTVSYAGEAMDEVATYIKQGFTNNLPSQDGEDPQLVTPSSTFASTASVGAARARREIGARVRDVVLALALCHNVTPTSEEDEDHPGQMVTSYQASSPDEIAIVRWTESVGLRLISRDRTGMVLESTASGNTAVKVRILNIFPFTSDGKRMGIIVHFYEHAKSGPPPLESSDLWFYQKGADTVMGSIVAANDWLDEETANMAREGLRTLVIGRKRLSAKQYEEFSSRYDEASLAIAHRDAGMQQVVSQYLERDLELLGITGVEDKLQKDVKPSLELLRNAGIKIWMLTGDKVETARCVAVSSKLVARGQYIYTIEKLQRKDNAQEHIDFLRSKTDACLLIDGSSLQLFLTHFKYDFISVAVMLPAVVACRCSPTQKADVATLIKNYTKKRVCCIGDGGNDVSMIQAADVGVGIVGKEGRQASLAADFSIEQFHHLTKLLVWHGRNSYKRSAKLAQFVMHRGLIIAVCQTMYSIALGFEPEGLYIDWLIAGYATIYTAAPVLSLVLDKDVDEELANLYPELYKELRSGRSLSYRSFFVWVFVSIYQGSIIQGLAQLFTEVESPRMVSVSYTALVLNELLMVAIEITTWHWVMVVCVVGTFLAYVASLPFLGAYFDLEFLLTGGFLWRVLAICSISLIPPYVVKLVRRVMKPPSHRKVQRI